MNTSQYSDIFSYDDESQDINLTLTTSQNDISSSYTPFVDIQREKLIWGTTINVEVVSESIKDLIRGNRKYAEQIENMNLTQNFIFHLDCNELNDSLKRDLCEYPVEMVPIFENCLREVYQELFVSAPERIKFRPYNIGQPLLIRNVDPAMIETIVSISGMVIRIGKVTPEIIRGYYECLKCGNGVDVGVIKGKIAEPTKCECGSKLSYELKPLKCTYFDTQIIKIQELPENIPDATTPMGIGIVANEDLIDYVVPGDKVVVTGVLKVKSIRLNPMMKKIKSSFRTYCEALSIRSIRNNGSHNETSSKDGCNFDLNAKRDLNTDDFIEEIDKLRKRTDIYDVLSRSIAPSIWGHMDVKRGLLLQLVGGVHKNLGRSNLRGDINILLAGDPGIAKSQLLGFVHSVSERGMYTSGRGSSAVGLTVSVSRDPDSGQFILESGALVLSDRGICCIDEFDKMADTTKSVLHEVMEQQTVSLAKAGIITTLNARCSILASCNPVESKYNLKKTILENINVMPTLLSRFDLVFLLIDKHDDIEDRRVANHILSLYSSANDDNKENESNIDTANIVNIELLKTYIKEARQIKPILRADSCRALREAYVELRQLDNGKSVTATTRQLESLIRLSEARAKIRFAKYVDPSDVAEASRLIKDSLLLYAVDPRTGRIDINMINTGRTSAQNKLLEDLKIEIMKIIKTKISFEELLKKTSADGKLLYEALNELETEDFIFFDKTNLLIEKLSKIQNY